MLLPCCCQDYSYAMVIAWPYHDDNMSIQWQEHKHKRSATPNALHISTLNIGLKCRRADAACIVELLRMTCSNNASVADAWQQLFLHISAPVPCHIAGYVTTDTDPKEALLMCSPTTIAIPSMD